MQADPRGARASTRARSPRGAARRRRAAPSGRRRSVAEDGAGAAGEDRREVSPLAGQRGAADRVDAAMDAAQAPALRRAAATARAPEPERPQLRQRDDAPLAAGELGEPRSAPVRPLRCMSSLRQHARAIRPGGAAPAQIWHTAAVPNRLISRRDGRRRARAPRALRCPRLHADGRHRRARRHPGRRQLELHAALRARRARRAISRASSSTCRPARSAR